MKKGLKKTLVALLTISTMATAMPVYAEANLSKIAVEDSIKIGSQIQSKFPIEKDTDRVYAQNRRKFKGYQGRGHIYMTSEGVEEANVFINGKKIDISKVLKSGKQEKIDISNYTKNGANTIKVTEVKPEGKTLDIKIPYPELEKARPEEVGFSSEKLAKIDDLINKEVEEGFPGATLLVLKDGKIIKNTAYGYKKIYDKDKKLENPEPMTEDTIFDLASNSKMFATNIAVQKLVSEGKLDLNEKVKTYIPNFKGEGRDEIKVKDLLTHTAGFASSIKFYLPDNPYGLEFYSRDREKTLSLLEKAPLEYKTGEKTIYSDTDYMLLGYIIENITGENLDNYVENNIYGPLGLKNTKYNPLKKGFKKSQFAATETIGNTRGRSRFFPNVRIHTLQGEVHDEKTFYTMNGVAGHAGLFSNTEDMAVLAQMLLNGGGYGDVKLFETSVLDQFTKPSDRDITFGLGWNRAGNSDKIWQFGPYASNLAIGHTGWTGTLSVIDPKHDMAVVLLTNKKHSNCVDGKFEGDSFETGRYGSIVSLVYEALLEK